jgi:uncharacterized membrane protein
LRKASAERCDGAEKIIRVAVSIVFIGVGIYLVVLWIQS